MEYSNNPHRPFLGVMERCVSWVVGGGGWGECFSDPQRLANGTVFCLFVVVFCCFSFFVVCVLFY